MLCELQRIYKGKAKKDEESIMGIKYILEPRNTGYEATMMGTSPKWAGGTRPKDLVMPTYLYRSK